MWGEIMGLSYDLPMIPNGAPIYEIYMIFFCLRCAVRNHGAVIWPAHDSIRRIIHYSFTHRRAVWDHTFDVMGRSCDGPMISPVLNQHDFPMTSYKKYDHTSSYDKGMILIFVMGLSCGAKSWGCHMICPWFQTVRHPLFIWREKYEIYCGRSHGVVIWSAHDSKRRVICYLFGGKIYWAKSWGCHMICPWFQTRVKISPCIFQ